MPGINILDTVVRRAQLPTEGQARPPFIAAVCPSAERARAQLGNRAERGARVTQVCEWQRLSPLAHGFIAARAICDAFKPM